MTDTVQIHANSIFTKENEALVDLYIEAATAVGAMSSRRNSGERCGDEFIYSNQIGVELTFSDETQRATWYKKLEELAKSTEA